ncbi:hypothetical protein M3223_04050 [Paenibacillus pasadenensis]|uniref:phage adaptor protein n=1 Tax=Paenibacillus pasadenensis TaxID=217090 RepID=UPI00203B8F8D|nr:hypothetical protein [Paenibacillus pasadenensis]MCM3746521.1 hypothetical protein [Paenibacillus pasadenensis]
MPTIQQLLDSVDLTYRNSFTSAQKVEWMDFTQRQIFQKVPKERTPYSFSTVDGTALYPLPADCDRFGIKEVTIETGLASDRYETLPFLSTESNIPVGQGSRFYSLLENMVFLNPVPETQTAGRRVFILYNGRPTALTGASPGAVPELEEDFHELLVLGCLERIARARGEIEDKNNFASDYNMLLQEYVRTYKLRQPEYYSPKDVMPQNRSRWGRGYRGDRILGSSGSRVSDLIPKNL